MPLKLKIIYPQFDGGGMGAGKFTLLQQTSCKRRVSILAAEVSD